MVDSETELRQSDEIDAKLAELKENGSSHDLERLGKIQALRWVRKETVSL